MTRIYWVITDTGGQVRGSVEAEEARKIRITESREYFSDGVSMFTDTYWIGNKSYSTLFGRELLKKQGYTNQKNAIKIKGFREENLTANGAFNTDNPRWLYHYNTRIAVQRPPQSFCYIADPFTREKAILMSIHQKWFDMIASGKKQYLFLNELPKLLRGKVDG